MSRMAELYQIYRLALTRSLSPSHCRVAIMRLCKAASLDVCRCCSRFPSVEDTAESLIYWRWELTRAATKRGLKAIGHNSIFLRPLRYGLLTFPQISRSLLTSGLNAGLIKSGGDGKHSKRVKPTVSASLKTATAPKRICR